MGNKHAPNASVATKQEEVEEMDRLRNLQRGSALEIIGYANPSSNSLKPEQELNTQGQIEQMKHLTKDNERQHTERVDAVAKDRLEKRDARKALYDAESEAQLHRNADSKTANAKKVSDLRSANENKMNAQRIANEAEVVETYNANSSDEHNAWMLRLRTQNKEQMAEMASKGAMKLSAMKLCGRVHEGRHQNEIAENEATHDADMEAIERKHETDLSSARQNRAANLTRHNHKMAEMGAQHKHERDEMKVRQHSEVDEQSSANDANAANEAERMKSLEGKNQSKMDRMCVLMRRTAELEAQIEANTERFFVLAEQVEKEKELMRVYDELQRLTLISVSAQMKIIGELHEEMATAERNYAAATQRAEIETATLEELEQILDAITSERKRVLRRMSRQIDALEKMNKEMLEKHDRALLR